MTRILSWLDVISPIMAASMSSFFRLSMIVSAFVGSAVMRSEPELMSCSGSML